MTPSSDQKTVTIQKPAAWAAIFIGVFGVVLSFNGRLAKVEANQVWMKATLTEIKIEVKDWHPRKGE